MQLITVKNWLDSKESDIATMINTAMSQEDLLSSCVCKIRMRSSAVDPRRLNSALMYAAC